MTVFYMHLFKNLSGLLSFVARIYLHIGEKRRYLPMNSMRYAIWSICIGLLSARCQSNARNCAVTEYDIGGRLSTEKIAVE